MATIRVHAYRTAEDAIAAIERDGDGELVAIEGKGPTPQLSWGVFDAGTAEDLLADDIGREKARELLSRTWVVAWSDYLPSGEPLEATLKINLPDSLDSAVRESDRSNWRHRLVLDPADLSITIWTMHGNGTPEALWHHRVIGLGYIPDGTADLSFVRATLERYTAEIVELVSLHEIAWNGSNNVGRFTDRERAANLVHEIHEAIQEAIHDCEVYAGS